MREQMGDDGKRPKTSTPTTTATGSKKSESSRHHGNCGSNVFLAIAILTFLHNSAKAIFFASIEDPTNLLKFQAGMEIVFIISIFILKILSVTYTKNTLRVACLLMMMFYFFIGCLAFVIWYSAYYNDVKSIQVAAILGACMDIVVYLLYLRMKQVKTE